MDTTLQDEYLTVAEAAALLKVSQSTVWRWIKRGELPAYRVGQRHVRVRHGEVTHFVTAIRPSPANGAATAEQQWLAELRRPLTDDEVQQWRAAAERAQQHSKELLAKRGGQLFSPSWKLINEARDERTRQLEQALGPEPPDTE